MFSSKGLLVALAALAVSVAANPIPAPTTGCAAVHVISARGSTEAPGEGKIGAIVDVIVSSSTQTISREAVDYPADLWDYPISEALGVNALKTVLKAKVAACPTTKIVLTGYSQGAQVVGDVLAKKATGSANVYVAILLGDVGHVHGESFQKGNATAQDGLFPRDVGALEPFATQLASFCDIGDPYCARGLVDPVHHAYFEKYGAVAVSFVLGRIGG